MRFRRSPLRVRLLIFPLHKISSLLSGKSGNCAIITLGIIFTLLTASWFGTRRSLVPRCPQYEKYIKLFDLGRKEQQYGTFEVELTFKFWELKSWMLNLLKTAEKQNISLEQVKLESNPPEFFNFSNYNLWGDGEFYSNGTDERILGQAVWRMQYIIGNYMSSRWKPGEDGATRIKAKNIFVGDWAFWGWVTHLKAEELDECESFLFGLGYASSLKPYRPTCNRHTNKLKNWSDFDAVASFSGWSSGSWAGTTNMEARHPDIPTNLPWFIFASEPPHRSRVIVNSIGQQHVVSSLSSSVMPRKYSKWIYYSPHVHVRSNDQDTDVFETKTRMTATMISNCKDVFNDRIGFIRELQKFTTVDLYGKCGDKEFRNSCSTNQKNLTCFEQMGKTYKFYLAFENSNCRDYITEKFHRNSLMNNMIPVVMGAHPDDYKRIAPENAFIHVNDFESPRQLAEYLEFVGNNREVYNSYFRWRGTGEFYQPENIFCTICPMLYYGGITGSVPPLERHSYSVNSFINSRNDVLCLPKSQWYWNKNKR